MKNVCAIFMLFFTLTTLCQNTSTTSIAERNYKKQDSIGRLFVNYILQEKYKESYDLMDAEFKKRYSYETFLKIIKPIGDLREKYGKEACSYRAGIFFDKEGKEITYFKYSFKNDTSAIPKVYIKIAYEGKESFKIKGIEKTVRQK